MRITLAISTFAAIMLSGCLEPDAAATTDPSALAAFEQQGHTLARRQYQDLPAPARVVLWRTHLARELVGEPLTKAQAAIVAEVQARLPELVVRFDPALAARAEAAFTPDQLGAWFELPGRWDVEPAGLIAPGDYDCDTRWCTTCLAPQPPDTHCGGEFCTATSSGCGWFGQQSCTRTCHRDEELPLE